jgi:hypothetical protein
VSWNQRTWGTLRLGKVSDIKVDLLPCRKKQELCRLADRILDEPRAGGVGAAGQSLP